MPKAVILDGNSLLYRGFFAMRALSTSDHVPTNAVYSFVLMILTILEREKPDLIFSPFDLPSPTFRHVEYVKYKSNRKAAPDDLQPQKPLAREVCAAFNIPVVEVEGFEADDVCGTLAEKLKADGFDVTIVTGDSDVLQLVDDSQGPVRVMITVKGVTDTILYDEAAVLARYGLTAAQIPDYKGLKGDSSDNLPGVPGIGEKGASRLLAQYGTVEALLDHLEELPEKNRAVLQENREIALLCKRLATIIRDVPLPAGLSFTPDYQKVGPDYAAVRALFERLEFRTLLKRLPTGIPLPAAPSPSLTGSLFDIQYPEPAPVAVARPRTGHTVNLVSTGLEQEAALKQLRSTGDPVGIALQSSSVSGSLADSVLSGIALSDGNHSYCLDWSDDTAALAAFLSDPTVPKSTYDVKTASGTLHIAGIELHGATFDPLLAAYLLNAGRSGYPLADLVSDHLKWSLLDDPVDPAAALCDRAAAAALLAEPMRARLVTDRLEKLHDEIELPLALLLAKVELHGVTVDRALLAAASAAMSRSITALEADVADLAGSSFSIGSTKQLQEVLFEKLKLPSGKKTKTGYSTGAEVLEELNVQGYEIAGKVLAWRELSKLKSTYADSLPALINPRTGRVHTSLNQTVASTGRLSSSNPNLQNIPVRTAAGQEIRRAFVPSAGNVLVSADYSQIELRIFAHVTGEPALLAAFQRGDDVHEHTARMIFSLPDSVAVSKEQRRQAKTINFAVLYGAGPFRVAAELGIAQSAASELIKTYRARYPGVRVYHEETVAGAKEKGYVETLLGRRRYVPDINSSVFQFRQAAEREAANMPIQGTCADIMKIAMLHVDRALTESRLGAKMILQVHDELLFECPPAEAGKLAFLVRTAMENACKLDVQLACEVNSGQNWWDVTPVEDDDASD